MNKFLLFSDLLKPLYPSTICFQIARLFLASLSLSVSNVVAYYTVTIFQLRPAPWACETVWTILQFLPNLHTHLLHAKQTVGCVSSLNPPG